MNGIITILNKSLKSTIKIQKSNILITSKKSRNHYLIARQDNTANIVPYRTSKKRMKKLKSKNIGRQYSKYSSL